MRLCEPSITSREHLRYYRLCRRLEQRLEQARHAASQLPSHDHEPDQRQGRLSGGTCRQHQPSRDPPQHVHAAVLSELLSGLGRSSAARWCLWHRRSDRVRPGDRLRLHPRFVRLLLRSQEHRRRLRHLRRRRLLAKRRCRPPRRENLSTTTANRTEHQGSFM